jgi:hypothetical protein
MDDEHVAKAEAISLERSGKSNLSLGVRIALENYQMPVKPEGYIRRRDLDALLDKLEGKNV